ncbi:MAG: cytochrome c maturation protein CcmE [Chthonomonadales bacterium]
MKPAYVVAFVILVASAGMTLFAFSGSIAEHVTIEQAAQRPGVQLQVPGAILKDTVTFADGALRFDIVPVELLPKDDGAKLVSAMIPSGTPRLTVEYSQPKPENFDNARQVEAIGTYRNGVFHATTLLVKCPSKYRDKKSG